MFLVYENIPNFNFDPHKNEFGFDSNFNSFWSQLYFYKYWISPSTDSIIVLIFRTSEKYYIFFKVASILCIILSLTNFSCAIFHRLIAWVFILFNFFSIKYRIMDSIIKPHTLKTFLSIVLQIYSQTWLKSIFIRREYRYVNFCCLIFWKKKNYCIVWEQGIESIYII